MQARSYMKKFEGSIANGVFINITKMCLEPPHPLSDPNSTLELNIVKALIFGWSLVH